MSMAYRLILIVQLWSFALPAGADPHYMQAMDPRLNGVLEFARIVEGIIGPLGVYVEKYHGLQDPDVGYDVYLYLYIFKEPGLRTFSLDIECLNYEKVARAYGDIPAGAQVADAGAFYTFENAEENIHWLVSDDNTLRVTLDPTLSPQAFWFYSKSEPQVRRYIIGDESVSGYPLISRGVIEGPSCEK